MKVVLATSLERGGPVEQAIVLASGLTAQGVSVVGICANESLAQRFSAAGAHAEVLPSRRWRDAGAAMRLRRLAAGADVRHAHDRRTGLWVRLG
ncbi:MAG: glycosyltransferase family 1 protein, partial [Actinomycetota bacterium]|nr:glycosyltransferase family 1 protein [Actinomycetota bacterium]